DKTAAGTDRRNHVEDIRPGTAANVEDCRSRGQSDPFQHEALDRLDRCRLLRLVHEPDEEVRIPGPVDLGEEVAVRRSVHADPHAILGWAATSGSFGHILGSWRVISSRYDIAPPGDRRHGHAR